MFTAVGVQTGYARANLENTFNAVRFFSQPLLGAKSWTECICMACGKTMSQSKILLISSLSSLLSVRLHLMQASFCCTLSHTNLASDGH